LVERQQISDRTASGRRRPRGVVQNQHQRFKVILRQRAHGMVGPVPIVFVLGRFDLVPCHTRPHHLRAAKNGERAHLGLRKHFPVGAEGKKFLRGGGGWGLGGGGQRGGGG